MARSLPASAREPWAAAGNNPEEYLYMTRGERVRRGSMIVYIDTKVGIETVMNSVSWMVGSVADALGEIRQAFRSQ